MGDRTFRHVRAEYDLKLHKSSLKYKLKTKHDVDVEYHHAKSHQDTKLILDRKANLLPLPESGSKNKYVLQ